MAKYIMLIPPPEMVVEIKGWAKHEERSMHNMCIRLLRTALDKMKVDNERLIKIMDNPKSKKKEIKDE
jgi:hypothetical protein